VGTAFEHVATGVATLRGALGQNREPRRVGVPSPTIKKGSSPVLF
jgi:hypothetical protein